MNQTYEVKLPKQVQQKVKYFDDTTINMIINLSSMTYYNGEIYTLVVKKQTAKWEQWINTGNKDDCELMFWNLIELSYWIARKTQDKILGEIWEHRLSFNLQKEIIKCVKQLLYKNANNYPIVVPEHRVVCLNGVYDAILDKFTHKLEDLPFSPYQINVIYKDKTNHEKLDKFFNAFCPDQWERESLLKFLSTTLVPKNYGVALFLWSEQGGSGKSTIVEMMGKLVGINNKGTIAAANAYSKKSNRFAFSDISDKTLVVSDEFVKKMDAEGLSQFKKKVNTVKMVEIERKNENIREVPNSQSHIYIANDLPEFKNFGSAERQRLLIIESKVDEKDQPLSRNDIHKMTYGEESLEALFVMLLPYLHILSQSKNSRNAMFFDKDGKMEENQAQMISESTTVNLEWNIEMKQRMSKMSFMDVINSDDGLKPISNHTLTEWFDKYKQELGVNINGFKLALINILSQKHPDYNFDGKDTFKVNRVSSRGIKPILKVGK